MPVIMSAQNTMFKCVFYVLERLLRTRVHPEKFAIRLDNRTE